MTFLALFCAFLAFPTAITSLQSFDQTFQLQEVISLEVSRKHSIGFIRDCIVAQDQRIFIADSLRANIRVHDSSGKLIRVFGRRGEEPGAFGYPMSLSLDEKHIYIMDKHRQLVHAYLHKTYQYVKSLEAFDGVQIKYWEDNLYLAGNRIEDGDSLHILRMDGLPLKNILETPQIIRRNHYLADSVSFDMDQNGTLYLVHEMGSYIYRATSGGKELSPFPVPREISIPAAPDTANQPSSRETLMAWANSWSHHLRLVVLKEKEVLFLCYSKPESKSFFIDIYNLTGQLLLQGIETNQFIQTSHNGNVYFSSDTGQPAVLRTYSLPSPEASIQK